MGWNERIAAMSGRTRIAIVTALVAAGAAGGAGAVSMTRPSIFMVPSTPIAIAKLSVTSGIVAVKGKVAEIFGDRFILLDASGRTMIDAGDGVTVAPGDLVTAYGRYDDGQLHASILIDRAGQVHSVGPRGPGPQGEGPGGDHHGAPHQHRPMEKGDHVLEAACAPVDETAEMPQVPAGAASPK